MLVVKTIHYFATNPYLSSFFYIITSSPIKSVLVVGLGGNIGRSTVKALLDE